MTQIVKSNWMKCLEAEENRKKLIDNFQNLSEYPENVDISKMWKL